MGHDFGNGYEKIIPISRNLEAGCFFDLSSPIEPYTFCSVAFWTE